MASGQGANAGGNFEAAAGVGGGAQGLTFYVEMYNFTYLQNFTTKVDNSLHLMTLVREEQQELK